MTARNAAPTRPLRGRPTPAAPSIYGRRLAERFHRFEEATTLLGDALEAGHPRQEIDAEKAIPWVEGRTGLALAAS